MTNMKLGTLVLVPALLFSTQVNADTLEKSDTVSVDYQAGKLDLRAKNIVVYNRLLLFLEDIYFTTYILEENIEFGDKSNIGKRPISVND